MKDIGITDHISTQGRAVARAIEALGTIESTGRLIVERGRTVELDDLADEVVQLFGGTFYARRASYGIMMLA
jgi:hypothetical protein